MSSLPRFSDDWEDVTSEGLTYWIHVGNCAGVE